ncbi:DUF1176 domain-containing protein [Undibacterium sp. JH2W]|uniref:DUF1176 domain-containing protein n=1 Tax=Undibacterium sp. JH2W TaxID=3413037 RepID=UPI003BEF5FFE
MKRFALVCSGISALLFSLPLAAQQVPGSIFIHKDWQLVCDNTRTCRAAGNPAAEDELGISLVLTRKAGKNQNITGDIELARDEHLGLLKKLPARFALNMRINGLDAGRLMIDQKKNLHADLSEQQVALLIKSLASDSKIEFVTGDLRWHISDQGAAAVFIKMDESQGRLGTKTALVKKGNKDEDTVLPALPIPVVYAASVSLPQAGDDKFIATSYKALHKDLLSTLKGDNYCADMQESGAGKTKFAVTRLSADKLLINTRCSAGAYNTSDAYWVVNEKPPFQAALITVAATEYKDGIISSTQLGSSVGHCWFADKWTWDGRQFVHTDAFSSSMCGPGPGSDRVLPTYVSEVRSARP